MRNSLRLLCWVAMAAADGRAAAAPAPAAINAAEALTRIESETLVLKARERQLAVQVAILQRQNEIAGRQDEGGRLSSSPVSGNPVVQSLEGIGRHQFATLLFESGAVVEVRVGDVLADGMRVTAIEPNGVIVETAHKKRMRLHLMGGAVVRAQTAPPPAPVSLPPLFPGAKGGER